MRTILNPRTLFNRVVPYTGVIINLQEYFLQAFSCKLFPAGVIKTFVVLRFKFPFVDWSSKVVGDFHWFRG